MSTPKRVQTARNGTFQPSLPIIIGIGHVICQSCYKQKKVINAWLADDDDDFKPKGKGTKAGAKKKAKKSDLPPNSKVCFSAPSL